MSGNALQPALSVTALEITAEAKGCQLVRPEPNEILIDLDADYPDARKRLDDGLGLLRSMGFSATIEREWPSLSGQGSHAVVRVWRIVTPIERVLLQASLGSDPRRELIAFAQIYRGDAAAVDTHSVLFQPTLQCAACQTAKKASAA